MFWVMTNWTRPSSTSRARAMWFQFFLVEISPGNAGAEVEPINVLGDDQLDPAQLDQPGQGHVGARWPRLVPAHVHVRLATLPLQGPDAFRTAEVGDASRGADTGASVHHC
jgi:hypothetical protein